MKLKFDSFSRYLLLSLLAMSLSNFAFAQRTISGTISDGQSGDPLIGANLLVVGTSSGTVTDIDGSYTLEVPEGATEIEISYTGYTTQKVTIGASNVLDFTLSPGEFLEEIVVVGYGTKKAKEITSSVASVKAEDFNKGNVNDPAKLLQGKVAGLSIAKPGSDPNGTFEIRLRGLSSVSQNSSPLIIVDGVPGASLQSVDPNDIATIDVLKDGSAAAIYGTRASAGVILITTKRGEAGKSSIEYNGYVTIERINRQVPVLNAQEFKAVGGPDLGANTNWFDQISHTGVTHVHALSLSGGTKNTSYRFSFNFRDIQGIARKTGNENLNGRLNLQQKGLNDHLTVTLNLSSTTRNSVFGFNEAFQYATIYKPTAPIFSGDPNDGFGGFSQEILFDYFNPVAIIEQNSNTGKLKEIVANIRGDLEIVDGLTASVFYSQQRTSDLREEFYSKKSFFRGTNRNGLARRSTNDNFSQQVDATLNFTRDFGDANISVLGGYSYQEFVDEGFFAEGGDFLTDAFHANNLSSALDFPNGLGSISSFKDASRLIAYFGRVSLNYNDTYFLDATYRREGSTRFGANNKWGDFYAFSGGFNLTNLVDIPGIDVLKLRAGYGVTGSLPSQTNLSVQRFGPGQKFFFNGNFVPSFGPVSNANPDLKWEKKKEVDVGLDFALFDYKLTGSLDYYDRKTEDLLLFFPVPVPPNLFPFTWKNIGVLNSNGFEATLNLKAVQTRDFSWSTGVTFSTFNTDIGSITGETTFDANGNQIKAERFISDVGSPGLNSIFMVRVKEGSPVGDFWGPVFDGIGDDGNFIFKDLNGDGVVEAGFGQPDNQVIGNGLPDFELGWNNSFTYKNFDLNFFFRGSFGHDKINTFRIFYETLDVAGIGTWNRVKTKFFNPKLTASNKFSSYHVENASFLKLDNATLGYTVDLPAGNIFKKMRFYVSGQNLLTITSYSGVDPEVNFSDTGEANNGNRPRSSSDILAPGIDRRRVYFTSRSVTFGLNLGF